MQYYTQYQEIISNVRKCKKMYLSELMSELVCMSIHMCNRQQKIQYYTGVHRKKHRHFSSVTNFEKEVLRFDSSVHFFVAYNWP